MVTSVIATRMMVSHGLHSIAYSSYAPGGVAIQEALRSVVRAPLRSATNAADMLRVVGRPYDDMCDCVASAGGRRFSFG